MGYYWAYRMASKPKSSQEAVIGKRLRMLMPDATDGEWLEGKIMAYDADSQNHEILLDRGTLVHQNLETMPHEWKNDQGQKPIEQLDLKTGKVLATFDSIADAARAVDGVGARITSVCQGRYKSSSNFFWRYKGSDVLPRKRKGRRRVEQLCLDTGRVIASFDTISSAGKAIGVSTPGISYCCNGRYNRKREEPSYCLPMS